MTAPTADVASTPPSRTGRNVPVAIGVGLVLASLVVFSLYAVTGAFLVVVAIATTIALHELITSISATGVQLPVLVLYAGNVVMLSAAYFDGLDTLAAAYVLTCLALAMVRILHGPQRLVADHAVAIMIVTWVSLLASFAVVMLTGTDGADRVVVFILAVVLNDTGGYVVGAWRGRHKMAPRVSPKKSWEGLAGSVLFTTVGCAVSFPLLINGTWWQGVGFGLVVVATATLGDLAESLVKRDLGVKDMGRLLPAHGGLMDRLDSLLPTAPVAFLLFAVFVA